MRRPVGQLLGKPWSATFLWSILATICISPATAETLDLGSGGARGYEGDFYSNLAPGTVILANGASWTVANSKVGDSQSFEDTRRCDDADGHRPINRYPLRIYRSPSVTLQGGRFAGEVPQNLSWSAAYCNSAAVLILDSPDATVRNLRIDAAWDGVRYTERHGSTENHRTEHVWVTRNRDDCIEADAKNEAVIEDVLCESFVGISAADKKISRHANTMQMNGVLISALEYTYRTRAKAGPPIKLDDSTSIGLEITNSVIVLNSQNIVDANGTFLRIRKSIRECSNNLLIWPHDAKLPDFIDLPDCFTVLTGAEEGRTRWQRIRQNWIDCHPEVPHLAGDPPSNPLACDEKEYGGMY